MSIQIQIRGGTTEEHKDFRGVSREITCDTDKNTVVVQDGQKLGGYPLAREDMANVPRDAIAERGIAKDNLSNVNSIVGCVFSAPLVSLEGFL